LPAPSRDGYMAISTVSLECCFLAAGPIAD
jgi:hypothetical protein